MCHIHTKIHTPCGHTEETIHLCSDVRLDEPMDQRHNIISTSSQSIEPCEKCQLSDLDIWHLDGAVKIIGDIETLVKKRSTKAKGQLKEAEKHKLDKPKNDVRMSEIEASDGEKASGIVACSDKEPANVGLSMLAMPYVGGLGLLVMAQKNWRPKAKL